ncbi:MAG: PVC-type heme-binding CxxCH protein [Isosphaeraceae bacterium]
MIGRFAPALVLVSFFSIVSSGLAQRNQVIPHAQDRPPGPALSPEEAIDMMKVPPGFQVELVAAEPDIVNPVAMTIDERGRFWITESVEYPRKSPGKGRDRVKILEDADGDGKAEKVAIFAEGLNIPSGIAIGHGGVWVANAPDILFLRDTNGDGKADSSEVVVTGFGREDTHELPNSLIWGPDGWLYGWNGVFNPAHIAHRGKTFDFTCAIFRIHPKTRDFEVWCEGTSNPWGIAFDAEGSAFASACVIDHLWHLVETGYYHRQGGPYPPDTWKIESIVDHKHQKAAYCGIHLFDSPAYPPEFREMLVMGNIHGNCINLDRLERRGSTYACKGQADFLTANDAWFMPVVQKTGPDGSLYILDWYDRYHCYQDANRDPAGIDRLKGRLYRVRYGATPRRYGFDLSRSIDDELIKRLGNPNVYDRDIAQRLLTERASPTARPKLEALVLDESSPRKARMHALWALVGSGSTSADFLGKLLAAPDPTFRAWGVRAAGNLKKVAPQIVAKIASMARDPSRDVGLQVAIAARKIDGIDAEAVLADVLLACGDDRLIPHIVWQNVHPLLGEQGETFLRRVATADLKGREAEGIKERLVNRVLARRESDPKPVVALIEILADVRHRDDTAMHKALDSLARKVQTGELAGDRLAALRDRLRPVLAGLKTRNPALALDADLLGACWKDPEGLVRARAAAVDGSLDASLRLRALAALVAAGDSAGLDAAGAALASSLNSADFRGQVLALLSRLDSMGVAAVVLAAYPKMEPDLKPRAVELLTDRPAWAASLLEAIGRGVVAKEALNVNQVRKLLASKDAAIAARVKATWGTIREGRNPAREQVVARMKAMLKVSPGDPNAGRLAFNKICAHCHKIYGEGQEVGPDLTANGRNDWDQLVSNVFDPSLVIGSAYQAVTIATADGRILTGLPIEEGKDRVVLKGQGGKVETIQRGAVEAMKWSDVSLMPEDVEKQLSPKEIADLFAFLALDRPPGDTSARRLRGSYSPPASVDNADLIERVAPGFTTNAVGEDGLALIEFGGRPRVLRTHPGSEDEPCTLWRRLVVPAGRATRLLLDVAPDPRGDWRLVVKANGRVLHDSIVSASSLKAGWAHVEADLTPFAGRSVLLELENRANGWSWEFGYWGKVEVTSGEKLKVNH